MTFTQTAPSEETLLTLRQSADYLHVTDRTVRNYIARGLIPGRRIGPKLLRIRFSDLERFAGS
ncbi:helix-turn-helix domain-containing protein [Mycolicibacterium boenickei]|uniref:Helix-turn-helix domain-containing protein n=1 Tax=Mycolicibacterium boenickei TaxID=146017 RepID=A0AAX2ZQ16_9MYCO|nr:DNA-binding protein [Mycolicibacterium boenickei]UNB97429.1 helix-turn-helix domain-containing protein [Mycolicibacterium boenickei]BBX93116.1 hypothetical protein MBOE_47650 [Mycolicibacterium boenickei]